LPITGFVGLDHLYLRSPGTTALKFIVNIFTFGYWYFYDLFQSISFNEDEVGKYGLSAPFVGPLGIGSGIFSNEDGAVKGSGDSSTPGSFMFMIYAIAVMIAPFGIDYFIAGDIPGGIFKLIMTFFFFGIGALIYSALNIFNLVVYPGDVLCKGTRRYFPFSLFADVNKSDVRFTKPGCSPQDDKGSSSGIFGGFFGSMFDWLLGPIKTVVSAVKKVPQEAMKVAKTAASASPSTLMANAKAVTESFTNGSGRIGKLFYN
jgi:hypothetical protein